MRKCCFVKVLDGRDGKGLRDRGSDSTFFRYQNTYQALALIFLKEVESVQRVEAKPYLHSTLPMLK